MRRRWRIWRRNRARRVLGIPFPVAGQHQFVSLVTISDSFIRSVEPKATALRAGDESAEAIYEIVLGAARELQSA